MTKAKVGPTLWSVSAVNLFYSCPLAFKYRYIDKVPKGVMPLHVRAGTVAHAGLEAAFEHRRKTRGTGSMGDEETWGVAKAAIAAEWATEKMPDPPDDEGQWDRIHEMVGNTLDAHTTPWEHIVAAEQKIIVTGDGTRLLAYIDLLLQPERGVAVIRDWKTRSTAATEADLANDRQLRFYAALVRRYFDWVEVTMAEHYYPPITKATTVTIDADSAEAAYWEALSVRDAVQREDEWRPVKGSQCQNCPYREDLCPLWAKAPEPEPTVDVAAINGSLF